MKQEEKIKHAKRILKKSGYSDKAIKKILAKVYGDTETKDKT